MIKPYIRPIDIVFFHEEWCKIYPGKSIKVVADLIAKRYTESLPKMYMVFHDIDYKNLSIIIHVNKPTITVVSDDE